MTTLTLPSDAFSDCEVGETKTVTLNFTITEKSDEGVVGDAEVESVEEASAEPEEEAEGEMEEYHGEEMPKSKQKVGPRAGLSPTIVIAIGGKKPK